VYSCVCVCACVWVCIIHICIYVCIIRMYLSIHVCMYVTISYVCIYLYYVCNDTAHIVLLLALTRHTLYCSRPASRLLPAARRPLPVARRSHLPYTARRLHSRHCRHVARRSHPDAHQVRQVRLAASKRASAPQQQRERERARARARAREREMNRTRKHEEE